MVVVPAASFLFSGKLDLAGTGFISLAVVPATPTLVVVPVAAISIAAAVITDLLVYPP